MEQNAQFSHYRFEELEVWQLAMQVVHLTYPVIKKFPAEERFALADQLRRATLSIVLNIVEGSGQPTDKGFAVYIHRAKASAMECIACVKIAIQEELVELNDVAPLQKLLEKTYFKLIALNKSISLKK